MAYTLSNYAADRYFPYAFFGGVWPAEAGLVIYPAGFDVSVEFGTPHINLPQVINPETFEQIVQFGVPAIEIYKYIYVPELDQIVAFGVPKLLSPEWPLNLDTKILSGEILQVETEAEQDFDVVLAKMDEIGATTSTEQDFDVKLLSNTAFFAKATPSTTIKAKKVKINEEIKASPTGEEDMAKTIKVVVNQANTGQLITKQPVTTVEGMPVTPTQGRLDQLTDVDPAGEIKGATLVYDANTDTYVTKKLDFEDIEGDPGDIDITEIDGGAF
jgi:hypothetical protein